MGLKKLEMDEQMSSIQNLRCDYSHKITILKKKLGNFLKNGDFQTVLIPLKIIAQKSSSALQKLEE